MMGIESFYLHTVNRWIDLYSRENVSNFSNRNIGLFSFTWRYSWSQHYNLGSEGLLMEKLTKQEYYDLLVTSAHDGTFPSINSKAHCMYRGSKNCRCPIGLIIPDGVYKEKFESIPINRLIKSGYILLESMNITGFTVEDLYEIQIVHDMSVVRMMASTPQDWSPALFVDKLSTLKCFSDVNKSTKSGQLRVSEKTNGDLEAIDNSKHNC